MPNIEILESFKFAERGVEVIEYQKDEVVEVSDECAEVAIAENWAKLATEGASVKKPKRAQRQIVDDAFESREAAAIDGAPEVK